MCPNLESGLGEQTLPLLGGPTKPQGMECERRERNQGHQCRFVPVVFFVLIISNSSVFKIHINILLMDILSEVFCFWNKILKPVDPAQFSQCTDGRTGPRDDKE